MSKGGLAGWLARNKDKKADPETLAWLRGEEAKDGRKTYAEWADGGNSIGDWLERGKKLRQPQTARARVRVQRLGHPPLLLARARARAPSGRISIEALGLAALARSPSRT